MVIRSITLASISTIALPLSVDFQVKPDKENVVSSRLEGEWQVDQELDNRLQGVPRGMETITVRSDAAVVETIPAKYEEFLGDKQLFMAGTLIKGDEEYPFVLIEHRGNPHMLMFRASGDDPMGDVESCNVMLAPAKDRAHDILLLGGDFNNEPFRAYERVEREHK